MSYHGYKNLLYPYIFTFDDFSVAVYQGKGHSLAQNLWDIMQNYPRYQRDISALGIIVDADANLPLDVAQIYADKLKGSFPAFPITPGIVVSGSPRAGIYVWPDSQGTGNLETLLIDCASVVHPDHRSGAENFINGLEVKHKGHWRGSDPEKALLASIVSILQPGQANHASFAQLDDEWVSAQTLAQVAGMEKFWLFLHELVGLAL
jgi:uncharacterized protein DUF3226